MCSTTNAYACIVHFTVYCKNVCICIENNVQIALHRIVVTCSMCSHLIFDYCTECILFKWLFHPHVQNAIQNTSLPSFDMVCNILGLSCLNLNAINVFPRTFVFPPIQWRWLYLCFVVFYARIVTINCVFLVMPYSSKYLHIKTWTITLIHTNKCILCHIFTRKLLYTCEFESMQYFNLWCHIYCVRMKIVW